MRILVCGGREYDDWFQFCGWMDAITKKAAPKDITIIQGGAKGADFLARVWAKYVRINSEEYPANWKKHGKGAGPIRNQKMLDEGKPDVVIAFPGGTGTADMVERARKAKVKVIKVM